MDQRLNPAGEAVRVGDVYLVGTDMKPGAERSGYLLEKLLEAIGKHLLALFGVHGKAERVGEVAGVTGHVNLRHNHHPSLTGITDERPYLLVGVELAFVASLTLVAGVVELWIAAALDTPGRMVGEMPMEEVEFIARHEVDGLTKQFNGLIVASGVVHETTQRIGCPVVNLHIGHTAIGGGELPERLKCPDGVAPHRSLATSDDKAIRIVALRDRTMDDGGGGERSEPCTPHRYLLRRGDKGYSKVVEGDINAACACHEQRAAAKES